MNLIWLSPLWSFSVEDAYLAAAWMLFIVTLSSVALFVLPASRHRRSMVAASITMLTCVLAVSSNESNGGGRVWSRIVCFIYILAIFWLCERDLRPAQEWSSAAASTLYIVAFLSLHYRQEQIISASTAQYMTAKEHIPFGASLYSVSFDNRVSSSLPHVSLLFEPGLHVGGYLAAASKGTDLDNFEADLGYFPMRYSRMSDPYLTIAPRGVLETAPLAINYSNLIAQTPQEAKYLVFWGFSKSVSDSSSARFLKEQLAQHFTLEYEKGVVQLYRLN